MPQKIQNPKVAQALTTAFGLVGRVRPALDEVVVPVVSIGDLSQGGPPPIRRHASSWLFQAANATERFVARFEVPGNVIADIRSIKITPDSTSSLLFAYFGSSFPTPAARAAKSYTDGRLLDTGATPAGVLTYGTQVAALADRQWQMRVSATDEYRPDGWVVGSGRPDQFGFIEFEYGALNVGVNFTLEWDEYTVG